MNQIPGKTNKYNASVKVKDSERSSTHQDDAGHWLNAVIDERIVLDEAAAEAGRERTVALRGTRGAWVTAGEGQDGGSSGGDRLRAGRKARRGGAAGVRRDRVGAVAVRGTTVTMAVTVAVTIVPAVAVTVAAVLALTLAVAVAVTIAADRTLTVRALLVAVAGNIGGTAVLE